MNNSNCSSEGAESPSPRDCNYQIQMELNEAHDKVIPLQEE